MKLRQISGAQSIRRLESETVFLPQTSIIEIVSQGRDVVMGAAAEFTDTNFENEVIQADGPVVVDFWATWCGPCRQIAPVIEELATENAGAVKVGKLDVDSNQDTAQKFGILNIPTILIFKNGEPVERVMGAQPKNRLQELIDAHK